MTIYPKNYYVYMYLREDGTPYYIGKGTKKRAWNNNGRKWKRPEDASRIKIHTDNLTEDQALSLEIELIAEYGRKDNDTGILRNLTDGGEGTSGRVHTEDTKNKISQSHVGKALSEVHKRKLSESKIGKSLGPQSEDHRRRIGEANKGKVRSEDAKRKMSDANKNKRPCIDGNGIRYKSVSDAAKSNGISYSTADYRCKNKLKGWSYI
jgi:hypothetical protein